MLALPGGVDSFRARHWQKSPLFVSGALPRLRPSVTRNELAWLATLDDVESRLVFTKASAQGARYTAETGPFDDDYLAGLPARGWTLLVHDVEKHLPAMRRLFAAVPFVPEWRIDDLMVSFAAPGGGVGPHTDNYDVFLCQGIGIREWHVSERAIPADPAASDDLALIRPFAGQTHTAREGDVLYLPPGVAHWGTARRACITYSIGMRAPQLSDLRRELPDDETENPFYADPDLSADESRPGYISPRAIRRAVALVGATGDDREVARALGRSVTATKEWLTPEVATDQESAALETGKLRLKAHGMARIAWDDCDIFVNGRHFPLSTQDIPLVEEFCRTRALTRRLVSRAARPELLAWMARAGAFEIPGKL